MKYSVQLKFAASFVLLLAVLLILLNAYPVTTYGDLVFSSKQTSMLNQAQVMASSLAPLGILGEDEVSGVMELLDIMPLSRVLITTELGRILYDTTPSAPDTGMIALLPELELAMNGYLVFRSSYRGAAFRSTAAVPVIRDGVTIGCVYLFDYDSEAALYLTGMQTNLRTLTVVVTLSAAALILVFTRTLTRRITDLVFAVRRVSEGDYKYRIDLSGSDELAELGREFNELTGVLQHTEEARKRFVSDASHELKTPLASIRLLSDSIVENEMDAELAREFAADIRDESERLERTTEKLLNLTRLDRENEIVRTNVDLGALVQRTLNRISPLAEQIELRSDIAHGCLIYAAEDDIFQVIFNLVENAIKYNLPGGWVLVTVNRSDGVVSLRVEDTGIGIPEADRAQIFSRFYRVDKARSRLSGGSGIGLSIVRDAVELHGGTVQADAAPGGGSVFTVRFPGVLL